MSSDDLDGSEEDSLHDDEIMSGNDEYNVESRRPRRRMGFWRTVKWFVGGTTLLLAIIAGALVGGIYHTKYGRAIFDNIIKGGDPFASYDVVKQFPDNHVFNVLLLGCDSDWDDTKPVALKGTNGRSDALMVAHFDLDNKTVNVISIPRDTAVRIPGHGIQKINAAHAFGGPALSQQTVKNVFGIDCPYYVRLNFDGFQQIVDAVGGVDLNVSKKLDYDDNWGHLHVHLKPGYQHLNGYAAMGFVRIRHSDDDLMRAERQHEFIAALKSRVMSPLTFLKIPAVLNALNDNIATNMQTDQMLALANFSRGLPSESIAMATMPSTEGPKYVYCNVRESEAMIRRMFFPNSTEHVAINVPNHMQVTRANLRGVSRRRHHSSTASVPRDDEGMPLVNTDAEGSATADADTPSTSKGSDDKVTDPVTPATPVKDQQPAKDTTGSGDTKPVPTTTPAPAAGDHSSGSDHPAPADAGKDKPKPADPPKTDHAGSSSGTAV
jgi:LCP family protein required for cell wall assembly